MSSAFDKLIEFFLKFPGIGPRQAKRFAFFLAGQNSNFLSELSRLILEIRKELSQCLSCFRFFSSEVQGKQICNICSSASRENTIMAVEKDMDLENIEKTGIYNGKYFVLGGTLSLSNDNLDNLRFKELYKRVEQEKPSEVIIALSATPEGENAARYIEKILEPIGKKQGLKVSRLAKGISTGTEMEYVDSDTISSALKNRR